MWALLAFLSKSAEVMPPFQIIALSFFVGGLVGFARVPTDAVAGFCLACAALTGLAHLAIEKTVWHLDVRQWVAVAALGMLPMGAAFYACDYGMKHGDVTALGAFAYAAPLLSTLVLIATGLSAFHWSVAAACLLITSGALLAGKDMFQGVRVRAAPAFPFPPTDGEYHAACSSRCAATRSAMLLNLKSCLGIAPGFIVAPNPCLSCRL